MKIEYEQFLNVFESCEKLPKTKDEYLKKLYQFYCYGRKKQTDEFKQNINNMFFN